MATALNCKRQSRRYPLPHLRACSDDLMCISFTDIHHNQWVTMAHNLIFLALHFAISKREWRTFLPPETQTDLGRASYQSTRTRFSLRGSPSCTFVYISLMIRS